jgi:hypothetical protein
VEIFDPASTGNTSCLHYKEQLVNAVKGNVAVYCDNYMEHINTLCGQNAEFLYVKVGGRYSNHWASKG